MKSSDIKNIWKEGITGSITPYSEEQLTKIMVKSARKSLRLTFPGDIFRYMSIGAIIFLSLCLIFLQYTPGARLLLISVLVFISACYLFMEFVAYRMRKYHSGKSLKEWLEFRINKVEKSVKFNDKYSILVYICSVLIGVGSIFLCYRLGRVRLDVVNSIVVPAGIIIFLWFLKRFQNRSYRKTLRELQELYKQFEESN